MTEPRFDDLIKYKIPGELYRDCMIAVGFPAVLVARCRQHYWITGELVKSLLDSLHNVYTERAMILSNELYNALLPEPPELEELP
jgi:hypothetical protein